MEVDVNRYNHGSVRRKRQALLYEQVMGEDALQRQLKPRVSRRRTFVEPDECNCGWIGQKARSYGEHHAETCPRRVDPLA